MITLALIGVGRWGKNYLEAVAELDNVKIKYICAQTQHTLNNLPNTYIKTLSINDLLKHKDIEGFILATPATTHFTIAKQLLSAGYNILMEKPLTVNYGQALELQKICQIKKLHVLISHTYLYNPAYRTFRNQAKHMKSIKSLSFEGLGSSIRTDTSVIWDWGPHPISIFLDLVKQPVVGVNATGSIKNPGNKFLDTVNATIQFINGTEASIHISWLGPKTRRLTIEGDNKKIEFDNTTITQRKIPLYPLKTPLAKELIEFIETIQGSKHITSDINMGVSVVKILSAIEQSVANGGQLVSISQIH